jgi:hypothetical protein
LDIIDVYGKKLGLNLNLTKCVVYGSNCEALPTAIIRASDGLVVLGSPVGSDMFVKSFVRDVVNRAADGLLKTRELNDPQMELLLLRCCTGAPKLIHWLRTCVPSVIVDEINLFDHAIDSTLQHILGTPVYDKHRLTMHLPLSLGGIGIPIVSISADAAFVSSIGASWSLQPNILPRSGFEDACRILENHGSPVPRLPAKINVIVTPLISNTKEFNQHKILLPINNKLLLNIAATSDIKKNVIMTGRACKGASYWLTTPPNFSDNTVIEASAFRALLKYSCGMPLFTGEHKCPDCNRIQDNFGHHAVSCKKAAGAIDKHNSIVNSIFIQMKSAGINCCSEAFNPLQINRQRPGDIYMPEFDSLGDAFFDISVISIGADSYYKRAAKNQLAGSDIRYQQKISKYPELGNRFKPLILESTGGWHPFSFNFLKTLADHIAARTNKTAKDSLNALLTAASFCLQRHQGTMLVRRCLGLL